MLKGNHYHIWVLDGSSDLMKVVTGLGEAGKFSTTSKGGTIAKIWFSFGPPFGCKLNFPGFSQTPDYFHEITWTI